MVVGGALAGVLGSSDWVNVPRCVIALVKDDEHDDVRHVQVVAGNRVPGAAARSFRITGVPPEGIDGEDVTLATDFIESDKNVEELLANSNSNRAAAIDKQALQLLILDQLASGGKTRDYLDRVGNDELQASKDQVYRRGIEPLREVGKIRATSWREGAANGHVVTAR